MTQLHETRMGQTLITHTLPELVRQVTRLADVLERLADLHVRGGDHQPKKETDNDTEVREEGTKPPHP